MEAEDISIFINNNNDDDTYNPIRMTKLERTKSTYNTPAIKYLGAYFDPDLNFKYHVSQLSKKLSYELFSLKNARNTLPLKSLTTIYFSLFHCHLI